MRNKWSIDLEIPIFKENRDYILSRLEDTNNDGSNVHYVRPYLENEEKAQKDSESETDKCDSCFEYQTKGLSACYEGCKGGV